MSNITRSFCKTARAERLKWFTSRDEAAEYALCSSRRLADYELGKAFPAPDVAAAMALAYKSYLLVNTYCDVCPVKKAKKQIKGTCCAKQMPSK